MTRRITILLAVLAMVAAACGGGDSADSTPTTNASTTTVAAAGGGTQAPTTVAETAAPTTTAAAKTVSEGTGAATIGDVTWDFALNGDPREQCLPDIGGTFLVAMFKEEANGDQLAFNITAQPNGRIVVQAGSPLISEGMWISDEAIYDQFPDLDPGVTAEVSIDGNTISGTATFYEDRSLRETLQTGDAYDTGLMTGSFTATCP